tara:strand:+ start:267 stop:461 length:195 start_codon:yes stop_codon:yes gene_type:complete
MTTKTELIHYRLQAILREHNMPDLEYLGEDDRGHLYMIGKSEVYADQITELESEESDEDESDPI